MRRPELYLLAFVFGLGGFVVFQAVRTPRASSQAVAPTPADEESGEAEHVSSELRPSAAPAPARDLADIRRRLDMGASGTYIRDLLGSDSLLTRWPDRMVEPIRVWIEPSPAVTAFDPRYSGLVRESFDDWSAAGIPLRFTFVVDSSAADVEVTWADSIPESRIGSTRRVYDQNGWIVDGSVVIATHAPGGAPLDSTLVRATALHEIGHLLGIGHTPDTSTIMSPSTNGRRTLGPADRATMRLLYSLPPGSVK